MPEEKTSQVNPQEDASSHEGDGVDLTDPGGLATGDISDVVLAESETLRAPTLPAAIPKPDPPADGLPTIRLAEPQKHAPTAKGPMAMLPGAKIDDFEIVRLLGRGAFGHVYLARQISLDRLVALKVSANRGSEGRTMARLEHQHIVQVFSETVDRDFNQRLLCMQLVPGIGLDKLVSVLHTTPEVTQHARPQWNGSQLLAIIDRSAAMPTALDPSALHDREALARMDEVEATAWFGSRLAEALDFAHSHGVLHRDIKPANILVNPYGRPMLADFNISSQPVGSEAGGEEMFGGTFAYMAPEHLDAFNPADETEAAAVTARSDIYSLGLVLQQMLDGRMAFPLAQKKASMSETLRLMSEERRRRRAACPPGSPGPRLTLERTICRCLAPNPADRFPSSAALAEQLEGCRQLRQAQRNLPKLSATFAPLVRRPFLWLVLLVVLPQIAGSIVNVIYNASQINLEPEQKLVFDRLVIVYNAIVYPIAVFLFVLTVRPVWKCWNALARGDHIADDVVEAARRRAVRLPRWLALVVAFGWFPGGIIFPVVIHMQSGIGLEKAAHFVASFFLSGLIALAYSLCGVESLVLRIIYPGLWQGAARYTEKARVELKHVPAQLSRIELFAGSIPLVASLMLLSGNETHEQPGFKFLVGALIVLGMVGFNLTSAVTRNLSQVVVALTRAKD